MPKKSQSGAQRVWFSSLSSVVIPAGPAGISVPVAPVSSLSSRLAAMADVFDEYAFKKLAYRLHHGGTITGIQAAVYIPGVTDTLPSTPAQVFESAHAAFMSPLYVQASEWQHIPSLLLAGMHSRYKTVPGTPESAEEVQGVLAFTGTVAESVIFEVRGLCEFTSPTVAAATPGDRIMSMSETERAAFAARLAASLPQVEFCAPAGNRRALSSRCVSPRTRG
jgi:hypothetical protein